ncbi:hypothetical protein ACFQH5_15880 [Halomonas salifodinae]|uniref:Uncharacterized protein n=1 Tax=Halomonas salifodinae TaxID=438745 RepID=A0ABW2EYH0_9GAMM
MITFLTGILLGISLATAGVLAFDIFGEEVSYTLIPNVVIAISAVIALYIHQSSVKHQKEEREWDIRKDILIQLSATLAHLTEETRKLCENSYADMSQLPEEEHRDIDFSHLKSFSKKVIECLHAYRPLLSKDLISALETYKVRDREIEDSFDIGEYSHAEAYEELITEQEKLQLLISNQIKKFANL